MPNVDINVAAAAEEMRAYTLDLLVQFVRCAGELGAGGIIVGPGKPNPLFPMPRDRMISYFYRALDTLAPLARQVGTRLFIENMPFAFLPDAESLMKVVDGYGDDSIRVIYDVANAHFIGEAPTRWDCGASATGSAWFIFPIRPGRATSTIPWAAAMFRSRASHPL